MQKCKTITIWTIALSVFIIIGAGHGIACIGLLEIGLPFVNRSIFEDSSFSLTASYDKSLLAAAIFMLGGHILLIFSILKKNGSYTFVKVSGLFLLWIAFYFLAHNFYNDNVSELSFLTGIPFLICSILLIYKLLCGNTANRHNIIKAQ